MRFIICYDLEDDKIRTRLSKILEEFGERIQYSVFEFNINDASYIRLKNKIKKAGVIESDCSISIYPVCEACYKKVERFGVNKLLNEDNIVF